MLLKKIRHLSDVLEKVKSSFQEEKELQKEKSQREEVQEEKEIELLKLKVNFLEENNKNLKADMLIITQTLAILYDAVSLHETILLENEAIKKNTYH